MTSYFDSASFFPPAREAVDAMEHAMRVSWGNPAALHAHGERAGRLLDQARHQVAEYVGCPTVEVALTGTGSAALDLGFALALQEARPGGTLVSSRLEHPHVQALVEAAEKEGAQVRWLSLPAGVPTDDDRAALAGASLVVLAAVNHELGTQLDLRTDAVRLVDAVQAAAWLPLDAFLDERTFVAFSGTKLGAPASVGALRAPRRVLDEARPRRRALELTPPPWLAAVGLGAACAARREQRAAHLDTTRRRADKLLAGLKKLDPDLRVNGADVARVGPIVDVSFTRVEALGLVIQLGLEGVAVSHTAACQARVREWSPVVRAAYPEDPERAVGAVRWSLSEHVTDEDVTRALATLAPLLARLRTEPPQPAAVPTAPRTDWSPW